MSNLKQTWQGAAAAGNPRLSRDPQGAQWAARLGRQPLRYRRGSETGYRRAAAALGRTLWRWNHAALHAQGAQRGGNS